MIKSINHVTYSVSDLKNSVDFYKNILKAKILLEGKNTAYFTVGGVWLALNEESDIPRNEIQYSYTHIAFSIDEREFDGWYKWLKENNVNILNGRQRDVRDKKSIYFTDPDGHKLELHTGTLEDRLKYYKEEKKHMKFYY
ncbi:FosB/FosD family fosfomycin resistance bacillithiol transferase [Staphylococcus pettenkoferi]|uniref:FosB/FosD family fosfomycin resistance bacillithiol transferase n=1 Tax=Staphylococcus pettenkoferi TaxID=170573 RepID=UPI00066CAE26|nr:FosB/FosD family fosfomycin resistance bacillithiol transferase [Staphylococcus pettenkoferi]MCI2803683.1 FosB/FosD family fosfomycin resistance bacillithiol transferase [Staphylococcus pettenkoferi]MCY1574610.1 FosB/FosD family fosfomycin resistance bacillithiol transferase [Staphylococcus pettenkoferi]MCY1578068.1 FosB/FosD family fosfomycin resistance bacillithiol transferase [Staphylococcus pettenkoferi]MCY1585541.1 FosB/FosD family fosfomycin resistance bacillithiol transferase [Staphyl